MAITNHCIKDLVQLIILKSNCKKEYIALVSSSGVINQASNKNAHHRMYIRIIAYSLYLTSLDVIQCQQTKFGIFFIIYAKLRKLRQVLV